MKTDIATHLLKDTRILECAKDELLATSPAACDDLRVRWEICQHVQEQIEQAQLSHDTLERALGKPASHSVVRAAASGRGRLMELYKTTHPVRVQPAVPALVRAPKVTSAGQSKSTEEGGTPIDVASAFAQSKEVLDATLAPAIHAGDVSLAKTAWRQGVRATVAKMQSGELDHAQLWKAFAAHASQGHERVQAFETLYSEPTQCFEGPLQGIPVAVKSLFWVAEQSCTASSKALCRWTAPTDADVVLGMRMHGATFLGAVRMDEFAMGGSGKRSAFGPTHHPFLPGYAPGGSSSGSAAAVAAGDALVALGSDTGGSVRQPASYCGLWGLKPTWGGLSRFGMVPYSFSFDTPGVMATRCDDLAIAFEAMASTSGLGDKTCVQVDRQGLMSNIEQGKFAWKPEQVRLGAIAEMDEWLVHMHPKAKASFDAWYKRARELGFSWTTVSIPELKSAIASYYTLVSVEAQSALARYDPLRFGFEQEALSSGMSYEDVARAWRTDAIGQEARQRVLFGALALSEPQSPSLYAKVCALREQIVQGFAKAFESVDFLVTPTTIGLPPMLGKATSVQEEWSQDMLSVGASLAGICAASAPWCSFEHDGIDMPLGVQIMAGWHQEGPLLGALWQWEQHRLFEDKSVLTFK